MLYVDYSSCVVWTNSLKLFIGLRISYCLVYLRHIPKPHSLTRKGWPWTHESMVKVTPDQTFPCEREREVWELGMTLLVLVCALALFTCVEETWEWGCMQVHAILQEVLDHAPLPAVDVVGMRLGTVPFGDSKCSLILMHAASLPIFQGEQG